VEPNPPSERFRELAARLSARDRSLPLADAALVLAAEFQPGLDPSPSLAELGRIAREAGGCVPAQGPLAERIDGLTRFLHDVAGFRGNEERYDDPRNSFLNEVLARRTGIPITLAIVYLEVGARIGLALQGVSFPGHFLLRTPGEPPLVIDAFHGERLDARACAARLRQALGEDAELGPERLLPASPSDVVVRMLGNLKHGYAVRAEWVRALECVDRILLVTPRAPGELRDRGLLWEQLECFGPALGDLERFLALAPGAPEAGAIRARVAALRPRAAAIH
jgi:regulator of sirC expression with transglutaminase-like and TPR domain